MIKKLINYLAITVFAVSLVTPAMSLAGGVSISSTVANLASSSNDWSNSVTANPGDEIVYSTEVYNNTGAAITGLNYRIELPSAFQYVSGSGKLYYRDAATDTDQVANVADSMTGNGAPILDIPANYFVYVNYKVKVSASAVSGTYATGNQVYGNGGLNVSTNNASVVVTATPGNNNPVTPTNPTNPQVQGDTSANIAAAIYNLTKGETNYSVSTSANPGDEIMYRVKLTNTGTTPLTGLNTRIQLPSAFEYVPNYSRALFVENGVEKTIALNDAIIAGGSSLPINVSVSNYIYIVYKVRVASNAALGTYGTGNQVWGDNGINVSANNATVMVNGSNVVPETRTLVLTATGYNPSTSATPVYTGSVNASRGDVIKLRVAIANNGNSVLKNVNLNSLLPTNMEYVAGSLKVVINGSAVNIPENKNIGLGDLGVGANGTLEFSAKVKSDTPENVQQLAYTVTGNADGIAQVSSVVNIYLAGANLPNTGMATTILAIILLGMFISVAGYMYLKESNALAGALKLIKR